MNPWNNMINLASPLIKQNTAKQMVNSCPKMQIALSTSNLQILIKQTI